MNIITTTVLRNNLADSLQEVSAKSGYLLVANKGKLNSAIVNIDLFEDLLAFVNKDYVKSIQKARKEYKACAIFSHEEAFGTV